jgi:hypothetical protein
MLKILFFILVFTNSTFLAFAQTEEKPKAYLFDEFESVSKVEVKKRTENLRNKLHDSAWKEKYVDAYLIFFSNAKKKSSFNVEKLVRDTLFNNCYDCFGWNVAKVDLPLSVNDDTPAFVRPAVFSAE